MSQRHQGPRRPRRPERSWPVDDIAGHSAVRVIPRELVADAIAASERSMEDSPAQRFPAVIRPTQPRDVRDVMPRLQAHRPVVLELDRIEDDAQRRRAMDFAAGLAYGLGIGMSSVAHKRHAFLLEPNDGIPRPQHSYQASNPVDALEIQAEYAAREERGDADEAHELPGQTRTDANVRAVCVLCDLRQADEAFESPLDMVIRRDGSRIHSPPALVCAHCRGTISHWRFVLGWCPECERWGRRSVMSPCGIPYGG